MRHSALLAKPGLLRTLTALYVVTVVVLRALGYDSAAESLGFLLAWLPADSPMAPAEATAVLLSAVALVRAFVRWIVDPEPAR